VNVPNDTSGSSGVRTTERLGPRLHVFLCLLLSILLRSRPHRAGQPPAIPQQTPPRCCRSARQSSRVLHHSGAMALAHALPRLLISQTLASPALRRRSCTLALRSSRLRLFLPPLPLPLSLAPLPPPHPCAATAAAEVDLPSHDADDAASAPPPPPETLEEFQIRPLLAGWMPPRYLWRAIAAFIIAGQVTLHLPTSPFFSCTTSAPCQWGTSTARCI